MNVPRGDVAGARGPSPSCLVSGVVDTLVEQERDGASHSRRSSPRFKQVDQHSSKRNCSPRLLMKSETMVQATLRRVGRNVHRETDAAGTDVSLQAAHGILRVRACAAWRITSVVWCVCDHSAGCHGRRQGHQIRHESHIRPPLQADWPWYRFLENFLEI